MRFGGFDVAKLISLDKAVSFEGREFLFVDEFPLENFDVEALDDLSREDDDLLDFRGDSSWRRFAKASSKALESVKDLDLDDFTDLPFDVFAPALLTAPSPPRRRSAKASVKASDCATEPDFVLEARGGGGGRKLVFPEDLAGS